MTVRDVCGAVLTAALTYAVTTVVPAQAQTRDASILPPEQHGMVTVVGCLQPGVKKGSDRFVLANPKIGPIASVPDGACSSIIDDRALELEDVDDAGIDESLLGRWIEVHGELEKETSHDLTNLRELDVDGFRLVPVVPPIAYAPPAAEPAAEPLPTEQVALAPPEAPVGTSGELPATLPKTASSLAAVGLVGLMSLTATLALLMYRIRS